MTTISQLRLTQFKELYKKYFGEELDDTQAGELVRKLVDFVQAGLFLEQKNLGKK